MYGEEHPETLISVLNLGVFHFSQKNYGKAEPLLVQAAQGSRRVLGVRHPQMLISLRTLVQLYETWGKPAEAARWRKSRRRPASRRVDLIVQVFASPEPEPPFLGGVVRRITSPAGAQPEEVIMVTGLLYRAQM